MKDNINVSDALIVLDKFVRNNSNEFESWEMVNILNTINLIVKKDIIKEG